MAEVRSTAAILEQVDALAVDTSVAHLSCSWGANMDSAQYISMLAMGCCSEGISPSFWYDSANLVRNVRAGDWMSSISLLTAHLSAFFSPKCL